MQAFRSGSGLCLGHQLFRKVVSHWWLVASDCKPGRTAGT